MSAAARHHGGAIGEAIVRYGGTRADWLDLSTGINPSPPPMPAIAADLWTRLPERELEEAAFAAARRFYGLADGAALVAAPGSQALISAVPHLFAPTASAVVEPTYSEHRSALEAAGHDVRGIPDLDAVPDDARLVVVVNPNNPDGRTHPADRLLALAARLGRLGGLLVVDEAFMDTGPAGSLAPHAGRDGLLVHRSFGKFFGYAGLRLGYALTSPAIGGRLAGRFGPWPVSGPALRLASAFMGDDALVAGIRETIGRQSALLRSALEGAGVEIVGQTPLFALTRHEQAGQLFEALCRRHILTRPFAYRPDWLRFGNPVGKADAARLSEALGDALAEIAGVR